MFWRIAVILFLFAAGISTATAGELDRPAVLPKGAVQLEAAGGGTRLDHRWTWTADAGLRVGLPGSLELAAPLAIYWSLISTPTRGCWILGGGVTDFFVTETARILWTPSVVTAARFRVAHTAELNTALDLMWIEDGFGADRHPAWLRGTVALRVSMGPWLTWSFGMAYQRIVIGNGPPDGADQAGFAGNARISIGSVRADGFSDVPAIAVHLSPRLDVISQLRMDIDTDLDTTDARFLGGIRLHLSPRRTTSEK